MFLTLFLFLLAFLPTTLAWFDPSSPNNLAIYWGQNSAGRKTTQSRLITYCDNPHLDIIILSFLTRFNSTLDPGNPVLNFANQGLAEKGDPVKCTLFPGSELFKCPELEEDIQLCQKKMGKTVLLSFGGDAYTEGGFKSEEDAVEMAGRVWKMFGPPTPPHSPSDAFHPYSRSPGSPSSKDLLRPFGHASVDGFDFDFEGPNLHSLPFAKELRRLMDEYTAGAGKGRKFFLSAAPQCSYPDVWMKSIMEGAELDMVFVQFYNNYCGGEFPLLTSPLPAFHMSWGVEEIVRFHIDL
jgi:chitinase